MYDNEKSKEQLQLEIKGLRLVNQELVEKNYRLSLVADIIKKGKHYYSGFNDSCSLVTIMCDPELCVTDWNKKAEDALGWKKEEVTGKKIVDLLSLPGKINQQNSHSFDFLKNLREGISYLKNSSKLGEILEFEWHSSRIYDVDGVLCGLILQGINLSERIKAENEYKALQKNLESLINSIDGAVWEASPESMCFSYVSDNVMGILGYEPDFFYKKENFPKIVHPDDVNNVLSAYMEAARPGGQSVVEFRLKRADGETVWIRDRVKCFESGKGKPVLQGIFVDITKFKKIETELVNNENKFRFIFENSPVGIVASQNGVTYMANKASLDLLGLKSADEVEGKPWSQWLTPESRAMAIENANKRKAGQFVGALEKITIKRPDGRIIPVRVISDKIKVDFNMMVIAYLIGESD